MQLELLRAILLDTHAWVWNPMDSSRLSGAARTAIVESESVHVSPISAYEVARKAWLGKWPEIVPHLHLLLAERQTLRAPLTRAMAARAAVLGWDHRDPLDRLIAATALEMGWPLVSKDLQFDSLEGVSGWRGRLWG